MSVSNLPDIIFLCGFMGAGKSTIGRLLAEKLGLSFMDLDEQIVHDEGREIPQIFAESGEKGFRNIEQKTVLKVIRNFEGVIALGGGTLQNQHLLDHIKLKGLLIFIEAPFSSILNRIAADPNRPLLLDEQGNTKTKKQLRDELQSLYGQRLPLYEQAVIKIKNKGNVEAAELVQQLIKKIKNHVKY